MMNEKTKIRISKFLSLVLRHRPETVGITLDSAGWVQVDALLAGCHQAGRFMRLDQLEEVVATNNKKRFEFSADGEMIRASQGHSVDVDLGYTPAEPPEILYHGTAVQNIKAIRARGLVKGKRHHVHLSPNKTTAVNVGNRYGKPVVLEVRAAAMADEGMSFFVSTNGVWLTDNVPPEYLIFPEN